MKTKFMHSLIQYLIEEKYYKLVETENVVLDENTRFVRLMANSMNVFLIEIVDTDQYSESQLLKFFDEGAEVLKNSQVLNTALLRVFLFDDNPDEEKLGIIINSQLDRPEARTYLKTVSMNINERTICRYFSEPDYFMDSYTVLEEFLVNRMDERVLLHRETVKNNSNSQNAHGIKLEAKNPIFTYVLIAINISVWLLLHIISFSSGDSYNNLLVTFGAKINALIIQGEFWRFLTPILLHSGIVHLGANCYSLYYLGTQTEVLYGHKRFAFIYLFSGFMGSIASFAFSTSTSVGASGAIFGLMGAMLYYIFQKPILLQSSIGINLVVITVLNLIAGFTKSGIDYFAHIGGLIGGFLIAGTFFRGDKKASKIWISGIRAVAIASAITVGGLLYGFYCPMNRVFPLLEDLKSYNDEQKWPEAEKTAEDILLQSPSDLRIRTEALWGITIAEVMQEKWEEGVEHANQLVETDPESGHYLLGVLYIYKEDYVLAREELLLSKKAGHSYAEIVDSLIAEIDAL